MPSPASIFQSHCPDDKLVALAETAGINCIHLTSVSQDDALTALTGMIFYRHMTTRDRAAVMEHRRSLPGPFRAALDRSHKDFEVETARWERGDGNMATVQGRQVDYESIGIRPHRIDVDGTDLHYAVIDGAFIVFRDNPNYWYYTQNAHRGHFNYYTAVTTQRTAQVFGAFTLSRPATKIPGISKVAEMINRTTATQQGGRWAAATGLFFAQEAIPLWGEIVGTPVPKSGTVTVLVWMSKDKETWDKRVRFDISPNGAVTHRQYGPR